MTMAKRGMSRSVSIRSVELLLDSARSTVIDGAMDAREDAVGEEIDLDLDFLLGLKFTLIRPSASSRFTV